MTLVFKFLKKNAIIIVKFNHHFLSILIVCSLHLLVPKFKSLAPISWLL